MQLTIELDADQIAHLAHLAEMLGIAREQDANRMHAIHPPHIIMAMNCLIDSFAEVLTEMDSPFQSGAGVSRDANILAHRMKAVAESMLEDQAYFEALQVRLHCKKVISPPRTQRNTKVFVFYVKKVEIQ